MTERKRIEIKAGDIRRGDILIREEGAPQEGIDEVYIDVARVIPKVNGQWVIGLRSQKVVTVLRARDSYVGLKEHYTTNLLRSKKAEKLKTLLTRKRIKSETIRGMSNEKFDALATELTGKGASQETQDIVADLLEVSEWKREQKLRTSQYSAAGIERDRKKAKSNGQR